MGNETTDIVKVGDRVKNFKLMDQEREEVHLYELMGKKVLLSFHPLAWTGVCAEQMKSLEENHDRFAELNTVALGISVDTAPSKKAWARELDIQATKLLSDFWPHGYVAGSYGIFDGEYGTSKRANILVNEDMDVIFVKVYPTSEVPDIEEVFKVLEESE